MTTKRLERTAERARVEQRRAQGAGYDERVSNLEGWAHISGAARDAADDSALASQVAKATTAMHHFNVEGADGAMIKITAGLAVKQAMKEKNHGLDRVAVAPLQTALAVLAKHRGAEPFDARRVVSELEQVDGTGRRKVIQREERNAVRQYRQPSPPPAQITPDTSPKPHTHRAKPAESSLKSTRGVAEG